MANILLSMPLLLARWYGQGDLHFVTCSCRHRLPHLRSPAARDVFLTVLEEARISIGFRVLGYVVMPEHFHLLISEPRSGNPGTILQIVKQRSARQIRQLPGNNADRVWERRFYDFNVWSDSKVQEKLHYMHQNPVRRGLVRRPEEWPWSSFRFYADREQGIVRIVRELLVSQGTGPDVQ